MTERQGSFCPSCGAQVQKNSRFCANCGQVLGENAPPIPPQSDSIPTQNISVPPPPPQGSGGAVRKTLVGCAGVFAVIFLVIIIIALIAPASDEGGSNEDAGGGGSQEAAVEETAEEAPEPEPEPISLSGQGSQATDFFELEEGLAMFDMSHQGQSNFVVSLLDEEGREVAFALANAIGVVEPSTAIAIPESGQYLLEVDADGAWNANITQPRPAEAPEQTSFEGQGSQATELFSMTSGLKRVNMTHQGESNFVVSLLDSEGREVEFALANEVGSAEPSTTMRIAEDGIYTFVVEADGPWTIEIE